MTTLTPIRKSAKLANVCYDIRGPVLARAKQMEEEGHRIIKLNIGNLAPFGFDAPDEIRHDVIVNLPNASGYSDSKGLFAARKAIMHYTQQKHIAGVELDDIYIGNGVSELIVMAMQGLLDNGDEVLVPAPDYPLWTAAVSLAGGAPRHYLCDEGAGWLPDLDDMRAKITRAHARASWSSTRTTRPARCTPRTCCARSWRSRDAHQLIVYADEIYDKMLYDGATHTSIASLADDVLFVTFNGLSKNYRACGYRTGWMVRVRRQAPRARLHRGARTSSPRCGCAPTCPAQYAIQTALGGYQSIDDLVAPGGRLCRQRDLAYELMTAIPGVTCVKPKAALYLFPRLDPQGLPDRERPAVRARAAAGGEGAGRAGQRLQLAASGPSPHRVPAQQRRPHRGDRRGSRASCERLPPPPPADIDAMKPINVGLLGIGTVGGGTWDVLARNQEEITAPRRAADRDHRGRRQGPRTGARSARRRQGARDRRRLCVVVRTRTSTSSSN